MPTRWISAAIAAFFAGLSFRFFLGLAGYLGNDALVYRAGAVELLHGRDPWSATINGYSYAAPPLELVPFVPLALIPEWIVQPSAVAIALLSGGLIASRLQLPAFWVMYPPMIFGIAIANPSIPGMAAVLYGFPLIGLMLRPQLLLVAPRRAIATFLLLSAAALLLVPGFIASITNVASRYAAEGGIIVNAWMTPLMIPAAVALLLLARIDGRAAAWLVVPAISPAVGWYGYTMVLPVKSTPLAVACAIPIPGFGAVAITAYAVVRVVAHQRDSPRAQRWLRFLNRLGQGANP